MTRAVHTLKVTGPPGAVFRVTDGSSRCVATGMYRLELELTQGIYTVSASFGRSIETREVLLDEPRSIELKSSRPSFGDRAFALGPEVLAALGPLVFRPGGQLVALRGPWRDGAAATDRVRLSRDGIAVPASREGFVADLNGCGVWSWQLFDLVSEASLASGAPGVLSVTRSVCVASERAARGLSPPERAPPASLASPDLSSSAPAASESTLPQNASHVMPHWGDRMVWAAYPALAYGAPQEFELPHAYYVRLRLTPPGVAPPVALQSLHDQVFTALGARTGLPLSKPVLDLMLLSDEADPLLAVAAAHLASITLGELGRLRLLAHDALTSISASGSPAGAAPTELQMIDADALQHRFHAWLEQRGSGPLASSPDMVAVRSLFGMPTPVHMRVPPVLLRSLDGLIAAMESPEARTAGTSFDESVWGSRLQISDAFAFLQWNPDIDYNQELLSSVRRSFESVQASAQFIEMAKAQARQQERDEQSSRQAPTYGKRAARRALSDRAAPRSAAPPQPDEITSSASAHFNASSLDIEAFIKSNVTSLRIPSSAMTQFGAALSSLSIDRASIASTLRQLTSPVKE